jgi:hypothetical protein
MGDILIVQGTLEVEIPNVLESAAAGIALSCAATGVADRL